MVKIVHILNIRLNYLLYLQRHDSERVRVRERKIDCDHQSGRRNIINKSQKTDKEEENQPPESDQSEVIVMIEYVKRKE